MKYLNNRGDTIIEVLLAIVILSSILTGAYVTSRRSLNNTRQAQERGEALKYVEGQIEQAKANAALANQQTVGFCFAKDGSGTIVTDLTNAQCKPGSIPGGYQLSVTPQVAGLYVINAQWDNVVGTGKDNIKMSYKVGQ